MAAPKKASKNNPDERKVVKQVKIMLSEDCAKCKQQCEKGKKYLADMIPGKVYNGVPCRK